MRTVEAGMFGFGKKESDEPDTTWFENLSEAQMKDRSKAAYFPVPEKLLKGSNAAFEGEYKSFAFTSLITTYRRLVSPIIYLHSSAKAMFLVEGECGGHHATIGPSQVFGVVSADLLQILDAAIDDTHTDLLILSDRSASDFDLDDRDAVLARAAGIEGGDYYHSLSRYHARLLRKHLSDGGRARFLAFRRAVIALRSIGLFHEDQVGPLALDMFPSLARRMDDLITRREALAWRPESEGDRVVDL